MKARSFADLMIGVLAYVSLSGLLALTAQPARHNHSPDRRWNLPVERRRRSKHNPEDKCRHCKGAGRCMACLPAACRVCRGSGVQPRDTALVDRLNVLWDGVS